VTDDPRLSAIPDIHGHAKGEHKPFAEERPIPYTARMLFLWFFHASRRGAPRFLMVADHVNYLTFEDPAAVNLVRRALKLAQAGDLYGAAETAGVEVGHAAVVSEGLRRGMRFSIGAEVDNDPRNRPDAQNIVDAMRPDGLVRSIHFLSVTHPQHGENWQWPFDNPEFVQFYETIGTERVWEMYVEALFDALEKQPTTIVAHFYVPGKFGHWPASDVLEGYENRLIELCAEHGIAIEINSRYLYKYYAGEPEQRERFRTAHLRLLRKAKAAGVAIAVGSDAHSPKDQGRAFEEVLALLDEVEINEIAFPLGGRLAHVALRLRGDRPEPTTNPVPAALADGERLEPEPPEPEPEPEPEAPAPVAPAKKPRPSRAKKPPIAAVAPPEPVAASAAHVPAEPAAVAEPVAGAEAADSDGAQAEPATSEPATSEHPLVEPPEVAAAGLPEPTAASDVTAAETAAPAPTAGAGEPRAAKKSAAPGDPSKRTASAATVPGANLPAAKPSLAKSAAPKAAASAKPAGRPKPAAAETARSTKSAKAPAAAKAVPPVKSAPRPAAAKAAPAPAAAKPAKKVAARAKSPAAKKPAKHS